MDLWQRLRYVELGWRGLGLLVAGWLLLVLARRRLPAERRHRGRLTVLLLGSTPWLHFAAYFLGRAGFPGASAGLHLVNLTLVLLSGAAGVTLLLFDVLLSRTRFASSTFTRDLAQAALVLGVGGAILRAGGVDPLGAAAVGATFTAFVGFAMQNALSNLGAGLLLQLDGALAPGDWIQLGGRVGRIVELRWRSVALLTAAGDLVMVPNAQLLNGEVANLSRPQRARRVAARFSVHHRHPPGEVSVALAEAIADVDGVLASPPPEVRPLEFARAELVYEASYWIDDMARGDSIEGAVRTRLWYACSRHRFEGPCPPAESMPEEPDAAGPEVRREWALRLSTVERCVPGLDAAAREALARALEKKRFTAGETLSAEAESVLLLASGEVRAEGWRWTAGSAWCAQWDAARSGATAVGEVLCFSLGPAGRRALEASLAQRLLEVSAWAHP